MYSNNLLSCLWSIMPAIRITDSDDLAHLFIASAMEVEVTRDIVLGTSLKRCAPRASRGNSPALLRQATLLGYLGTTMSARRRRGGTEVVRLWAPMQYSLTSVTCVSLSASRAKIRRR